MNAARPRRQRGLTAATIFTVLGVAILFGLGNWQLERMVWKEALIETTTARLAAAPENLPPPAQWSNLDRDQYEFRRVMFPAELLNGKDAFVYTSGSAFRPDVSGPGYWVFTPARLPGGSMIVVNRGFVPLDRKDAGSRPQGALTGLVDFTGVMRWPEARRPFTPDDEPQNNVWHRRDPRAIAAAKDWGAVAPFYVEQERPQSPGGLPQAGQLAVKLPNNHLQYAITWFGLAAALAGVYLAWLIARQRLRRRR